ncbi:MAG: phosphatase PAP2 family protein [Chitinophagaceae bacterium]
MKKIIGLVQEISSEFLVTTFLLAASLLVFAYIADENVVEKNHQFDTTVMAYVKANTSPLLVKAMLIITFFGSTPFLLPAYILLIASLILKNKKVIAMDVSIIAISSTLAMFLLKAYFKRHRPDSAIVKTIVGYSFPSGHTVSSFVFCSILAYLLWKTNISSFKKYITIIFLLLCTIAIGLSRIILMVHFATDVIAAFCFGIAWVLASFWAIKKIRKIYSLRATT